MVKINPFAFSRPIVNTKTFSYVDSRYPDTKIEIRLRSADAVDISLITDTVNSFIASREDKPPFVVDGRVVPLSPSLIQAVATIYVLQEMGDNGYTMEELLAMSVTLPSVFNAMCNDAAELAVSSDLGKVQRVQPSEPLSNMENATPN